MALDLSGVRAFCAKNGIVAKEHFEQGDDPSMDPPLWIELTGMGITFYVNDNGVESIELSLPFERGILLVDR